MDLVAIVFWIVFVWRLPKVNLRTIREWYGFIAFLGITVVATTRNLPVAMAIDNLFGYADIGRALGYSCMVITAFELTMINLSTLPKRTSLYSTRRWVPYAMPLVLLAILLVWMAELQSGQTLENYISFIPPYRTLLTSVAQTYLFLSLAGVGLAAACYHLQNETNLALKLRFSAQFVTYVLVSILSGSIAASSALMTFNIVRRSHTSNPLFDVLIILATLSYCLFVLPAKVYTRVGAIAGSVQKLKQMRSIQWLEGYTAELLSVSQYPLSISDALRNPTHELLRLIVAILDRRKALRASKRPLAQEMAKLLDDIAQQSGHRQQDQQYEFVIDELEKVAKNLKRRHSRWERQPPLARLSGSQ